MASCPSFVFQTALFAPQNVPVPVRPHELRSCGESDGQLPRCPLTPPRPPRVLLVGEADGELPRTARSLLPDPHEFYSWEKQMVSYDAATRFLTACSEYSPNVPT